MARRWALDPEIGGSNPPSPASDSPYAKQGRGVEQSGSSLGS